jgi:2-C-methyl-D-erythritol 4-phosphate cytidylyltransferase/2-C-methyl-D-erythritol 2,4-cyclodiphosphate synthase
VSDALLGAAGEPDIGCLFPASDPSFRDVSSLGLLSQVAGRVRSKGWTVVWVDIVLHAQVPRLGARVSSMISSLSNALDCVEGVSKVNLKVKSGEKTGSVGNPPSIECYAVATLERNEEGR